MLFNVGIDVGGVLRNVVHPSSGPEGFLSVPPVRGSIETVEWLTGLLGREHVFIVSKCPEGSESVIVAWLDQYGFFSNAGLDSDNIRFSHTRENKARIACELSIDYFIDDRIEVLDAMNGIVDRRVLFMPNGYSYEYEDRSIIQLASWDDVHRDLMNYLTSR
jgi:hypothetical protein